MSNQAVYASAAQKISPRQWARLVFVYLLIPIILFLCAGDIRWWQAWIYSVLIVAAGIISRVLAERRHPGLLAERINMEKFAEGKRWDKVLSPLMAVSISFPLVIVAGLDHRWNWSPDFSLWLNLLGFALIAAGYSFASWAVVENRFFSGIVRIQADRDHTVCDSGPYRIVRHPGYSGNFLALIGTALTLSSLWTLIPAAFAMIVIVIRTALEDRTLQAELPGYREYARRVRFRLIPGIF